MCLQPAKNTQNSKPRPPTANAKMKGKRTIKQNTARNSLLKAYLRPQQTYKLKQKRGEELEKQRSLMSTTTTETLQS